MLFHNYRCIIGAKFQCILYVTNAKSFFKLSKDFFKVETFISLFTSQSIVYTFLDNIVLL